MSGPQQKQKAEENAKKLDEALDAQIPNRIKLSPEAQQKVEGAVDFVNKYLPTTGKVIDGVITLGKVGSEAVETVGGAINTVALYPFKLFDDLFRVSDAASNLKKHICGCGNETEPQSSRSIPLAKPALKARE